MDYVLTCTQKKFARNHGRTFAVLEIGLNKSGFLLLLCKRDAFLKVSCAVGFVRSLCHIPSNRLALFLRGLVRYVLKITEQRNIIPRRFLGFQSFPAQ